MSTVQIAGKSLPQYSPTPRELDDVELLRMGALTPSSGFGGPESPVTLEVPSTVATWVEEAGALELIDPEGVPLAVLTLESSFERPGGQVGLVGPIRPLPGVIRRAFSSRYGPPSETKASLDDGVLTVPVLAPLTVKDLGDIRQKAAGNIVLFIVMVGHGTPRGMSAHGLIRATFVAADSVDKSVVVAVPVASRQARAQDKEFQERVVAAYAPGPNIVWPEGIGPLSPEMAEAVKTDRPTGPEQGLVVFFTGLSGSGKSTIAQALRDRLFEDGVRTVSLLDGDRVRRKLSAGLTFSAEDRETNIERIGWVAAEISRHGGLAICSPIAPFDRTRRMARTMADEAGGAFVLIYIATPLDVCERRDRKGLYAKARRGEIEQFTGISSPYEIPTDTDLSVDTTDRSVDSVLGEVLQLLNARGFLRCGSIVGSEVKAPV